MKYKVGSIILGTFLLMLAFSSFTIADDINSDLTVSEGEVSVYDLTVNDGNPVNPADGLDGNKAKIPVVKFKVHNPNGWNQTRITTWPFETKKSAYKVGYGYFNNLDQYYRFNFAQQNTPWTTIANDDGSNFDINVTCPTGDCRKQIKISTVNSNFDTEVKKLVELGGRGNYLSLRELDISQETHEGGPNEIILEGGDCGADPQYSDFDYCNTSGNLGASKDGRSTLVMVNNNQNEYILIAIERATEPDYIDFRYMISDTPDFSVKNSDSREWFGGLSLHNFAGKQKNIYELSKHNEYNTVTVNEINSTTAEVIVNDVSIPVTYGATSEDEVIADTFHAFAQQIDGSNFGYQEVNYTIMEYTGIDSILPGYSSFDFGALGPTESKTLRRILVPHNNIPVKVNVSATDFTDGVDTLSSENTIVNIDENIQTSCYTQEQYTITNEGQQIQTIYPPMSEDSVCDDGGWGIPDNKYILTIPADMQPTGELTNTFTWTMW